MEFIFLNSFLLFFLNILMIDKKKEAEGSSIFWFIPQMVSISKAGSETLSCASTLVKGGQVSRSSFSAFPSTMAGNWIGSRAAGTSTPTHNASVVNRILTHNATMLLLHSSLHSFFQNCYILPHQSDKSVIWWCFLHSFYFLPPWK